MAGRVKKFVGAVPALATWVYERERTESQSMNAGTMRKR
jgi:hypothetical protein